MPVFYFFSFMKMRNFEKIISVMAKMTKVFGAILCFLGTVIFLVSLFVYMNTSAHLDYNAGKQPTLGQVKLFVPFLISIMMLTVGVLFSRDRVLEHHDH
jgi:hypothetical protein